MPGWLRWVGLIFVGLIAVLGAAYWWYFLEAHVPEGQYALSIDELRALANSTPGDKPAKVRVEHVASGEFSLAVTIAGGAWTTSEIPFQSYQAVYPDGKTVIIDTAMDRKTASSGGEEPKFFDDAAYQRVITAMDRAAHIVVTHEHYDHIGGLATAPNVKALMAKAVLTKEQIESTAPVVMKPPAEALAGYTPLSYDRLHLVAPGVVLIKAAGHTPGSQLVYVQLADSTEYLFLGDVAWKMANVDLVRERPRVVTETMMNGDRDKISLQLAAIKALKDANPKIHVMPGHDRAVLDAAVKDGWMTKGFE